MIIFSHYQCIVPDITIWRPPNPASDVPVSCITIDGMPNVNVTKALTVSCNRKRIDKALRSLNSGCITRAIWVGTLIRAENEILMLTFNFAGNNKT